MRRRLFTLAAALSLLLLAGCARDAFVLSDESAMNRLMTTKLVAEMRQKDSTPLVCWVEEAEPEARMLYLGENHADHAVRMGSFRVTADGRVWKNADPTLLEDRWVPIE